MKLTILLTSLLALSPAIAPAQSTIQTGLQAGVAPAVRVTESDGVVMPIEQDVASVLVANPDIANVQPLSDRSLFLYGKAVGTTKVFVLNTEDEIILEHRIVVTRSLRMVDASSRGAS